MCTIISSGRDRKAEREWVRPSKPYLRKNIEQMNESQSGNDNSNRILPCAFMHIYVCQCISQFVHLAVRKMRITTGSYYLQTQAVKKQFIAR